VVFSLWILVNRNFRFVQERTPRDRDSLISSYLVIPAKAGGALQKQSWSSDDFHPDCGVIASLPLTQG
jgi:hypothetical protein